MKSLLIGITTCCTILVLTIQRTVGQETTATLSDSITVVLFPVNATSFRRRNVDVSYEHGSKIGGERTSTDAAAVKREGNSIDDLRLRRDEPQAQAVRSDQSGAQKKIETVFNNLRRSVNASNMHYTVTVFAIIVFREQ